MSDEPPGKELDLKPREKPDEGLGETYDLVEPRNPPRTSVLIPQGEGCGSFKLERDFEVCLANPPRTSDFIPQGDGNGSHKLEQIFTGRPAKIRSLSLALEVEGSIILGSTDFIDVKGKARERFGLALKILADKPRLPEEQCTADVSPGRVFGRLKLHCLEFGQIGVEVD